MIVEAERMSNAEQDKSYCKRHQNNRNDKSSNRISSPRIRKRSRSRSRDCAQKYNTYDYSLQRRTRLKEICQKPKDNDYYQQTASTSSCIKNWKKDKSNEKRRKITELPASEPKEIDLRNINSMNKMGKGISVLTEAEMNKLGARIIKAELMGDDVRLLFY